MDGCCSLEVDGVPPVNTHDQLVGALLDRSVNETASPAVTVVGVAIKLALGLLPLSPFVT